MIRKAIVCGLFLHFLAVSMPLFAEVRTAVQDFRLLWGKNSDERRAVMWGGLLDSVEDHEFIAGCNREIPSDADVLIVTNSMANVYILNYHLFPRKTSTGEENLDGEYWTVHYFTPKALELNRIEGPQKSGAPD